MFRHPQRPVSLVNTVILTSNIVFYSRLFFCVRVFMTTNSSLSAKKTIRFAVVLVAAAAGVFSTRADTYTLQEVTISDVPKLDSNRITYTIALRFRNNPKQYWVYYDLKKKALAVDFYGCTIQSIVPKIRKNKAFKSFSIENRHTEMTLTGEQSLILIGADPGWHYEASSPAETIILLNLWREIKQPQEQHQKSYRTWFIYIGTTVVAGIIAFFVVSNAIK
jgi:hypothetical protein